MRSSAEEYFTKLSHLISEPLSYSMFKFSNENPLELTNVLTKSVEVDDPLAINSSKIWYPISSETLTLKLGRNLIHSLCNSSIIVTCSIIGID